MNAIYAELVISYLHVKHITLDGQTILRSNKKHKGVHISSGATH